MASSYTGLGTELMTTGENAGTWGTTTNTNLQIIEQMVGGYIEKSIAGGAQTTTLTVSDGSTGAELSHRILKLTGTITGNQVVTIPLDVQQMFILVNGTSGAYTVQFKYATGSGSSLTFAATDKGTKLVYATADDGTNPNLVDSGIGSTAGHDLDGNELILDADADTSITADTDDQIDIKIAGADDFQFTANTFTAQSGSTIAAQALTATTVTASGIVKTDDTTAATTTTDGSLQTDGGLSVAADAVIGDDLKLLSDSAVLSFGADSDTTLTHTDGTGLTLNSTNKLLFGDTGTYIHQSADGVLDLVSDTEIEINATTIDINGAIAMDGAITGATNITLSGELDAATLDISGNADIDGTLETDALSIASTTITTTAAEINLIDGGTSRGTTAVASGDGILINDAGTMRMTNVDTVSTYFASHNVGGGNIVTTGALDSGSITSGFGAIDNGTSNIRSATITAETAFVPDASGGADLGTTALEFNDLFLNDSGSIQFGDDQDTTLVHTDGTGLTLNSTNKLCFYDTALYIHSSTDGQLDLVADTEIQIAATTVDLNGILDVSGVIVAGGQISASDGTAGAPSISNTGDLNSGLYFSAADTLAFSAGGTAQFTMADGVVAPVTDNDVDLGTSSLEFKDGYFDGTLYCDTLNLAGTSHTTIEDPTALAIALG